MAASTAWHLRTYARIRRGRLFLRRWKDDVRPGRDLCHLRPFARVQCAGQPWAALSLARRWWHVDVEWRAPAHHPHDACELIVNGEVREPEPCRLARPPATGPCGWMAVPGWFLVRGQYAGRPRSSLPIPRMMVRWWARPSTRGRRRHHPGADRGGHGLSRYRGHSRRDAVSRRMRLCESAHARYISHASGGHYHTHSPVDEPRCTPWLVND